MDLKNKDYIIKEFPKDVEAFVDSKNVYYYLSYTEDICVKEHYDNAHFTMSYLCYNGIQAVLGAARENELRQSTDSKYWEHGVEETVKYIELDNSTVFVTYIDNCDPFVSKVVVKDGAVSNYELPADFVYDVVDKSRERRPFTVWKEVLRNEVCSS